jgi:hypothetical protein
MSSVGRGNTREPVSVALELNIVGPWSGAAGGELETREMCMQKALWLDLLLVPAGTESCKLSWWLQFGGVCSWRP